MWEPKRGYDGCLVSWVTERKGKKDHWSWKEKRKGFWKFLVCTSTKNPLTKLGVLTYTNGVLLRKFPPKAAMPEPTNGPKETHQLNFFLRGKNSSLSIKWKLDETKKKTKNLSPLSLSLYPRILHWCSRSASALVSAISSHSIDGIDLRSSFEPETTHHPPVCKN